MSSLHRDQYARNPAYQPRPSNAEGVYLGADQWLILGETYTGSVSTCGGGYPTVGMTYPCASADPSTSRHWMAFVEDPIIKVRPRLEALIIAWTSYRSDFAGDNAQIGLGVAAEDDISLVDERTPILARFDGVNEWVLYEEDGNSMLIGPEVEQETPGFPVEMILIPGAALLFYEDGQFLRVTSSGITDLNPIGTPSAAGTPQEYKPRIHPGRFAEDDGGIGVG